MTLFSKIIAGEVPSYKIAENDKYFAFLDLFPSVIGHTLVVPKIETDRLFDLPDEYLDGYLSFCKPISNAICKAFGVDRVNIITLGFEIPHAHIHLVPMNSMRDSNIVANKTRMSEADLLEIQRRILAHLS